MKSESVRDKLESPAKIVDEFTLMPGDEVKIDTSDKNCQYL